MSDTTVYIPWQRVHPISPFIRSWSALLIFVYLITSLSVQTLQDIVAAFSLSVGQSLLLLLVVIILILLVAIGLYAISWRFYQFRITSDAVELHAGVIFRRRRYMRLDRLQAVDIDRPFFARIFGLSKLALHAADGSETTLTLEYLKETDAEQLRREILHLASGAQDDPTLDQATDQQAAAQHSVAPRYPYADYLQQYVQHNPHGVPTEVPTSGTRGPALQQPAAAPKTPPRDLLTIPFSRVVGSAFVSGLYGGLGTGLFSAISVSFFVWLGIDSENSVMTSVILLVVIFVAVTAFVACITAFALVNTNFNFTARTSDAGVRISSGMLSTTSNTIPPGRIQAIEISRSVVYRIFGWYRIQVTVAGYGLQDSSTTVLPVGKFDGVITMMSVLAPDPGVEYANDLIYGALKYTSDADGFTGVPGRARLWQPVAGGRHGYTTTPTLLLIRYARLRRILAMIPHERIQQSAVYQSLSDKLSGTVSARFLTPPGPVRVDISNHEPGELIKLFFDEAQIAAHARRMTDRNQWMADDELAAFDKASAKAAPAGDRR